LDATVLSPRRGRRTMKKRQYLIEIDTVKSKSDACRYIGKKVVWRSEKNREIYGKITRWHGNKGVLRVRFKKGLPGQAIGTKVKILV